MIVYLKSGKEDQYLERHGDLEYLQPICSIDFEKLGQGGIGDVEKQNSQLTPLIYAERTREVKYRPPWVVFEKRKKQTSKHVVMGKVDMAGEYCVEAVDDEGDERNPIGSLSFVVRASELSVSELDLFYCHVLSH